MDNEKQDIPPMVLQAHNRVVGFINLYVKDDTPPPLMKQKLLQALTLLLHVDICILEMLELAYEDMKEAFKTKELKVYNSENKKIEMLPLSADAISDLKELFLEDGKTGKIFERESVKDFTWLLNEFISKSINSSYSVSSYRIGIKERRREREEQTPSAYDN